MNFLILFAPMLMVFAGYAAVCYYVYKIQARLLYPGDGLPFGPFDALNAMSGQAVSLELDGQKLRYYTVPARGEAASAWVLLFHGNRHGARERFDFAQQLTQAGCTVVLAEYPGYAGDATPITQPGLLRNALAMADQVGLLAQGLPIFYFGESLGTGIATYVAMRRQARGLLLSTPYTSLAAVAKERYPLLPILQLIKEPLPAFRWAPHVLCPVFIVHGTQDRVVSFHLGRTQARNFRVLPVFVAIDGPGHSDIRDRFPELYWGGVIAFIRRCLTA